MEAWMEDAHRQKRWDDWLSRRPVCTDCGEAIRAERYFPSPEGPVCPKCVDRRMVEIEDG